MRSSVTTVAAVVAKVAESCRVRPDQVTLLIAPTASLAGGLQVVARSVEARDEEDEVDEAGAEVSSDVVESSDAGTDATIEGAADSQAVTTDAEPDTDGESEG